ncbi:MAG TPA: GNAT family N-acetyltransferase [Steroidobacteraceae bacterium]|nr:GNAT family N-acetyltransferase [Steroidobacteraceae bacterium]
MNGSATAVSDDTIKLRKAVSTDLQAVTSCAQVAYGKYIERIGKAPAPMHSDFAEQIAQGLLYIAMRGPRFAGYVAFFPEGDHLHLDAVAVLPEHSGKGVGKALIGYVEQVARDEGFKAVELYTNEAMTENLVMYPKLGYQETHRKYDEGYNRVFYRKTL